MTEKIKGVVGYAFDTSGENVLVIRKKRPASQAGKLNGVGGKLEPGETFLQAMVREFGEETGIQTLDDDWTCFAVLDCPEWDLAFFKTVIPMSTLEAAVEGAQMTDENLELWDRDSLMSQNTMRNLRWMIPFCADTSPYELPVRLKEVPKE